MDFNGDEEAIGAKVTWDSRRTARTRAARGPRAIAGGDQRQLGEGGARNRHQELRKCWQNCRGHEAEVPLFAGVSGTDADGGSSEASSAPDKQGGCETAGT